MLIKMAKILKKLIRVKPIYLIIVFLICTGICIFALRHNNEMMVKLRSDVYQADKQNGNANGALINLRNYVYSHMNTDLSSGSGSVYPPIQLTYTYQRLEDAAVSQAAIANADVYTDAEEYCQAQNPVSFSGRTRVPCVEQYVLSHDQKPATIPTSLYQFDFVSPTWTPDFAGWSLVVSIALFIWLLINTVYRYGGSILKRVFP